MIEFAPFATGRPPCMLRSSFDSHDSTVEDDRRLLLGGGTLLLHPFPILPERGEFLTKRNELFDPPPLPFPIFTSSIFLLSIARLYAWRGRKVEEFEKRRNSVSSAHVPGTSFYCGSMNREMKRYTKGKPSTSPFSSLFFCITTIFRTWTSLRIFHLVSGRWKRFYYLLF